MPQFHLGPGPEEDERHEGPARVLKSANFVYSPTDLSRTDWPLGRQGPGPADGRCCPVPGPAQAPLEPVTGQVVTWLNSSAAWTRRDAIECRGNVRGRI